MIPAMIVLAGLAAGTPTTDGPANARTPASVTAPTPVLAKLVACRQIADAAQRLSCFDREVALFDQATQSRQVVVLDQEQVRRTRRSLFGFPIPSLKLFGGGKEEGKPGKGDDAEERAQEIQQIDTVVTDAARLPDGRIGFGVEDGARWVQDDDRTLMLARIRAGIKVRISRGVLGSYFAAFDGSGSVRVRRAR